MITHPTKRVYPVAILMLLTGVGSSPVLAEEPAAAVQETSHPIINELIGRILKDPSRDYSSVSGPDDCSNEALYHGTKEQLGDYVATPMDNQEALRDYIFSGKEQCKCTLAIIGKNFNILLKDLGTDISQVPCT